MDSFKVDGKEVRSHESSDLRISSVFLLISSRNKGSSLYVVIGTRTSS